MALADRVGPERYGRIAIFLHWTIAALIAANLVLGFLFHQVAPDSRRGVLVTHRSLGLTILLLTILRLAWRLWARPPALSAHLRKWERILARSAHATLYLLMLVLPLTGWIMSSADTPPRSVQFWMLTFPPFPFPAMADETMGALHNGMAPIHRWLAWSMIALVALHISGALKHQLVDRSPELERMLPLWLRGRNRKDRYRSEGASA
jgi:cytochrome b561